MPIPPSFPPFLTSIAGVPVPEIVQQYGTPVFVYDEATILSRLADLECFDVVRYAQKANSNLAILSLLRKAGAKVDAVSAMEIRRALAAGFRPHVPDDEVHDIVYTADIFDREALELCVQERIHVNCGSIDMIEQLGKVLAEDPDTDWPVEITLRINPGFGHGHSQKTNTGGPLSKHGIWFEQLDHAISTAGRYGLLVTGLHFHIGSGTDFEHLSKCCDAMERMATLAGSGIHTISTGGGLPTVYRDTDTYVDIAKFYALWDEVRCRLEQKFQHGVTLEIEPGRYLVAESGYLIAELRAVKYQAENAFYMLDAGFNNLIRPSFYGSYHPMSVCTRDGSIPTAEDAPLMDVIVGGPLCESGDIFTQKEGGYVEKRTLPRIYNGDLVIIGGAGAYSFVMGSNYNSKLFAPEVLIRDGKMVCIRRRQTFEQLIENEILE